VALHRGQLAGLRVCAVTARRERHILQRCPDCNRSLDPDSNADVQPRAGQLSVCFGCGCMLTFLGVPGSLLRLRRSTPAELAGAPPELFALVQRIRRGS
jgi:hypothetical protein